MSEEISPLEDHGWWMERLHNKGAEMKHNYLMRMIKEAGGGQSRHPEKWDIWEFNDAAVERFAKLVYESAFRDANIAASATIIDAAVLEEREACAKVCEELRDDWLRGRGRYEFKGEGADDCADAIRARGKE